MKSWMKEIECEMERARSIFPDSEFRLTAFSEEYGEVVKAVLDHMQGKANLSEVKTELIQAGAMIGRLLEEGDPTHSLPPLV